MRVFCADVLKGKHHFCISAPSPPPPPKKKYVFLSYDFFLSCKRKLEGGWGTLVSCEEFSAQSKVNQICAAAKYLQKIYSRNGKRVYSFYSSSSTICKLLFPPPDDNLFNCGHGHGFYLPSLLNVFSFISFMCDLLWKSQTCVVKNEKYSYTQTREINIM